MTKLAEVDNRLALCQSMAHMIAVALDKISDNDASALDSMYVADNIKAQIQQVREDLDAIEGEAIAG